VTTGEYESGDVNTIGDEDEFDDEAELEDEDDYEDGDVNAVASESSFDDMAGNRSEGSTPTAVLTYIAKALSDEPDAVVVQSEERRGSVRLRLHVAPEDMGRVIGRRGRTALK